MAVACLDHVAVKGIWNSTTKRGMKEHSTKTLKYKDCSSKDLYGNIVQRAWGFYHRKYQEIPSGFEIQVLQTRITGEHFIWWA